MRVLSLFSGIDAVSAAWKPLGWEIVAFSEIEPFPCKVLAHHYPDVPNLGDITKITESDIQALGHIDLVVFGSPCQDLSIAGIRKGLDGNRSGLFFTAIQIVRWSKARFALWENVPGAFSSNKGNDFAAVVREMGGSRVSPTVPSAGWGTEGVALGEKALVEWATLDAQWFGVAQRRRRCFALADFGDWTSRPPILLEPESVRGDTAPSRKKGQEVTEIAGTLSANGGRTTLNCNHEAPIVMTQYGEVAGSPTARHDSSPCADRGQNIVAFTHRMVAFGEYVDDDTAGALKRRDYKDATDLISYGIPGNWIGRKPENGGNAVAFSTPAIGVIKEDDVSSCISRNTGGGGETQNPAFVLQSDMQVRRLTPRECERLQGFPEIKKICKINVFQHSNSNVCLSDQQSTNALAAQQFHKSPNNASPAEENEFPSSVNAAEQSLNANHIKSNAPVLVSAQIDLERQHLQLHSQGRSLLSVSIADAKEWCRLPIRADDFVQLSVALLACLEKMAPTGRAALHLNTSGSFPLLSGNWFASQSGREIEELASDAEKFMGAVKKCTTFITSEAGRNFQNYDSNLQTLLCCVSTVICSFIPSEIQSASSYALSIEVSHGYTLTPWRKKPASECPDGPRYKALGNSMAVPVMCWIGQRIKDAITAQELLTNPLP